MKKSFITALSKCFELIENSFIECCNTSMTLDPLTNLEKLMSKRLNLVEYLELRCLDGQFYNYRI